LVDAIQSPSRVGLDGRRTHDLIFLDQGDVRVARKPLRGVSRHTRGKALERALVGVPDLGAFFHR
jgi:hypothetical protein